MPLCLARTSGNFQLKISAFCRESWHGICDSYRAHPTLRPPSTQALWNFWCQERGPPGVGHSGTGERSSGVEDTDARPLYTEDRRFDSSRRPVIVVGNSPPLPPYWKTVCWADRTDRCLFALPYCRGSMVVLTMCPGSTVCSLYEAFWDDLKEENCAYYTLVCCKTIKDDRKTLARLIGAYDLRDLVHRMPKSLRPPGKQS